MKIRFEKKDLPRQTSDPGPDPLSRFANHGIRGIHGKGAQILMGLHSACSVCSPAVATCHRSHLSPDGGSFTRHAPPLGSGWLRFGSGWLRLGSGWLRFGNQPGWAKPWIVHGWQIKTADLREINGEAITSLKFHKCARPITFICVQRIEFDREMQVRFVRTNEGCLTFRSRSP